MIMARELNKTVLQRQLSFRASNNSPHGDLSSSSSFASVFPLQPIRLSSTHYALDKCGPLHSLGSHVAAAYHSLDHCLIFSYN